MYWNYFKYILQHKWYVFLEAMKEGLWLHAFTHDLSKFLPSEFKAYADKFYGGDYCYKYFQVESNYEEAWLRHQRRNKHHWDYWVKSDGRPVPMPRKYVRQMVVDWRGMSRKFGDSAEEYFQKNYKEMTLHIDTESMISSILNTYPRRDN